VTSGGRALILAGGGVRVAWQAGAVQALDETGLRFQHGDGTSGGIFTLGMLLSGVAPADLGARWRSLDVRRFLGMLPRREYLRSPTSWRAVGGAGGIERHVLPKLGIDLSRIRAASHMTGSFNVADFGAKRCVAIPHTQIDLPRLLAGVSLPIVMPAVEAGGRTWTDAVWIQDANCWEAVRRGCTELWVLWCIGNTPRYGTGALEQYVHMIELSANSALFGELERIAELNERRLAGEPVLGSTDPVTVHVVTPLVPLPLDPDLLVGRIDTETLVAMGYRDAMAYLGSHAARTGVDLRSDVTAKPVPALGARITLRVAGALTPVAGLDGPSGPARILAVVQADDLAAFARVPAHGAPVLGALTHPTWGYRPFTTARLRILDEAGTRRLELTASIDVDGAGHELVATSVLPDRGRGRWARAAEVSWQLCPPGAAEPDAIGRATISGREGWRMALSFEPSGATNLAGRARAGATALGLVRRRFS
jgi:predicted acylesterase/phospholipase RssA